MCKAGANCVHTDNCYTGEEEAQKKLKHAFRMRLPLMLIYWEWCKCNAKQTNKHIIIGAAANKNTKIKKEIFTATVALKKGVQSSWYINLAASGMVASVVNHIFFQSYFT